MQHRHLDVGKLETGRGGLGFYLMAGNVSIDDHLESVTLDLFSYVCFIALFFIVLWKLISRELISWDDTVRHGVGKMKDHTFTRISSVNNMIHTQAKELEDSQPDQKGMAVYNMASVFGFWSCTCVNTSDPCILFGYRTWSGSPTRSCYWNSLKNKHSNPGKRPSSCGTEHWCWQEPVFPVPLCSN